MPFSIKFPDELPFLEDGVAPHAHGVLSIGDFQEDFYSSLFHWSQDRYRNQWREAIHALVDGADKAALIVSYFTPEVSRNLEWWPMYREGAIVHFQNHLLFFDQLKSPFSPENPLASLHERRTMGEGGDQISEWHVNMFDLEQFLRTKLEASG